MYFEYSYITEILPKVEIWCSSHRNDKVHVESLLKLKQFFSIPAQCKPHTSLNTSRGIIRCPNLAGVSIDDIIDGLADQNVIQARRITITRDGIKCETNRIILTFQTAIIPKTLKVGYLEVPVDLYIPNPLHVIHVLSLGIMKVDATLVATTYVVIVLNLLAPMQLHVLTIAKRHLNA